MKETKLTKEPVSVLTSEVLDKRRIGLMIRAVNIALDKAGQGHLRIGCPNGEEYKGEIGEYISLEVWKVDKE